MKTIIALFLTLSLFGCTTTSMSGPLSAYKTAPTALSMLKRYIGEDEQANAQLAPQIQALAVYYDKARGIDSKTSFLEFFEQNGWQIRQAVAHWQAIVAIVGDYAQRTQNPVPQELVTFRKDVENAYRDLGTIIAEQDRSVKIGRYVEVLALMVKLGAASNGVIL